MCFSKEFIKIIFSLLSSSCIKCISNTECCLYGDMWSVNCSESGIISLYIYDFLSKEFLFSSGGIWFPSDYLIVPLIVNIGLDKAWTWNLTFNSGKQSINKAYTLQNVQIEIQSKYKKAIDQTADFLVATSLAFAISLLFHFYFSSSFYLPYWPTWPDVESYLNSAQYLNTKPMPIGSSGW